MNGKNVTLLCKIIGMVFSTIVGTYYIIVYGASAQLMILIGIGLLGLIIANMAFPVDISKILLNWRGGDK